MRKFRETFDLLGTDIEALEIDFSLALPEIFTDITDAFVLPLPHTPLDITLLPIERASISTAGAQFNVNSDVWDISDNGDFTVFQTGSQIYVYDNQTDTTEIVSVDSNGNFGNSASTQASISADGRYVAFRSFSTNLVANDTNSNHDIFVHDRLTGLTELISQDSSGVQLDGFSGDPEISADGQVVAFRVNAATINGTYIDEGGFTYNRSTGVLDQFVNNTNGMVINSISADGQFVMTHGGGLRVYDLANSTTTIVPGGLSNGSMSSDGRYVVYSSTASNLVANDTNGTADIFRYDIQMNTVKALSYGTDGFTGNGASGGGGMPRSLGISADGRFVSFSSAASNLVAGDTNGHMDVFVYDNLTDDIFRVDSVVSGSEPDAISFRSRISDDSTALAFESWASNLVNGDTNGNRDVFVLEIDPGNGCNVITGTDVAETITGTSGCDDIDGMEGDDILEGLGDGDMLDGGSGIDTATYTASNKGVAVNLTSGTGVFGHAAGDTLTNIEWLQGTNFNDRLTGDSGDNVLWGGFGKDILRGLSGADQIYGEDGNDDIQGHGGDDFIEGGTGADNINGGTGRDYASYDTSNVGVLINLQNGTANFGHAVGDTLTSIENLIGSSFDDVLLGNNGVNQVYGNLGNDKIYGRGNRDELYGDAGNDLINGGSGQDFIDGGTDNDTLIGGGALDTFYFGLASGDDIVTDFAHLSDFADFTAYALTAFNSVTVANTTDILIDIDGSNSVLLENLTMSEYNDAVINGNILI